MIGLHLELFSDNSDAWCDFDIQQYWNRLFQDMGFSMNSLIKRNKKILPLF